MVEVYLSPSMQEHNIGAGNYGTEEQVMNRIFDVVEKDLKASNVTYKRNKPSMTLSQAIADSNASNAKIHVAGHSDAGGNGTARGTTAFYCTGSIEGQKLSQGLYDRITAISPVKGRGVKPTAVLAELTKTKAKASLIEVDFHDNPEGAAFILANIEPLGHAFAQGICDYLGKSFVKYDAQKISPEVPKPSYPGMAYKYRTPVMKGSAVVVIQSRLRVLGLYKGVIDGSFGPATDKAVRAFQKSKGIAVDGSVGPITWAKLF